ncbi:hypothetical protein GDO86_019499 [Hymenochirus boettgeri]|uniref:Perilipin n=1 Tax=Hymenochirus boettgeri TaxID=247094 RepID=A0A8T2IIR1_9PIPI|nr:hypothetical protein GDO86_019499 [Hymenochirus boettgeri]
MTSAVEEPQNVVTRIINLPLVSSTYSMVSSIYGNTKDSYPCVKVVCDVAEKSVKSLASVAITSALPIVQKMETQITMANNIACMGLDKIEEKLPILYQPSDKVVANASDAIAGAKDNVLKGITGVVGKTKGTVQDTVEMTKAAVNGGINTVIGSSVVQKVRSGVDNALEMSETLLEQYLPPTDEELSIEATNTEGFEGEKEKPNYYVRLGSLSSKAQKRAYQQAVTRINDVKSRSREAISQMNSTMDLIDFAKKNVTDANQKVFNTLVEWTKGSEPTNEDQESADQIESRILTMTRNLTQQLQTTCLSLVTSVQGLPHNIQDKAHRVSAMAGEVYHNFRSVSSLKVSDHLLITSRGKLQKMKDSLDDVMDYLVNNTPLNWLVGPFYPQLAGCENAEQEGDEVEKSNHEH